MPFSLPRWAWIGIGGLLAILAFYAALSAYGNARYKAGVKETDAKWQAASDKLIQQAAASGKKADIAKATRDADFAARQETEKEKLDHAQQTGASPLDVLFGNSD